LEIDENAVKPSIRNAVSKPGILIALFKVGSAACSLGFLQTTLEPHLSTLKPALSSFQVGALFMVVGGTYGLSLPLWGFLCDSKMTKNSPKFVEVVGAILITVGFLILGPFKYLPFKKSLGSIIVGMSIHGFGLGASVVGGFSDAHKSAIKAGFPDTIDTYGLVSGLWTSVFAFGAFVGPTFGGILFDAVTFRWAIFLVIIGELISLVMLISYLCVELCGSSPPSPPASLASDTDQFPSLPTIGEGGYGTTSSTIGARMRKYSESVGRSYVASSVARSMSHGGSHSGFTAAGLGGLEGSRRGEREPLIP
jgi:MFS family permease